MSLAKFRAKNHAQQARRRGPDDAVDDRGTTAELFAECVEQWGPFTLDAAASPRNTKCELFYTRVDDGLTQPWRGHRVWCNPPFSDLGSWVAKAIAEHVASPDDTTVTLLLPANRCEQGWWQDLIEPYRDRGGVLSTRFLRDRRRFILAGDDAVQPGARPPFGLVVAHLEGPDPIALPSSDAPRLFERWRVDE